MSGVAAIELSASVEKNECELWQQMVSGISPPDYDNLKRNYSWTYNCAILKFNKISTGNERAR
jgi:hypothetical protein